MALGMILMLVCIALTISEMSSWLVQARNVVFVVGAAMLIAGVGFYMLARARI